MRQPLRILALTFVFLLCGVLTTSCADFGGAASAKQKNSRGGKLAFNVQPYLQSISPTSVTVIWIVDQGDSLGWVDYGEGEAMTITAKTVKNGLLGTDGTLQKITLSDLTPGTQYNYRVSSKKITTFKAYDIQYGETLSSEVFSFRTPGLDQDKASFLVFNDIHQNIGVLKKLIDLVDEKPYDMALFNGDLMNYIDDEESLLKGVIRPFSEVFSGTTPYVYVRGNHDVRGRYARHLDEYIASPNGEYYYAFSYGPVRFLVMDLGEDKPDDSSVFAGLVDFTGYREAQRDWLAQEIQSEAFQKASFRILMSHIPITENHYAGIQSRHVWGDLLKEADIDLHLAGHTHEYASFRETADPLYCPVMIGGAPNRKNGTVIRLDATGETLHVVMTRADGEVLDDWKLTAKGRRDIPGI